MESVVIGLAGAGRAAELHLDAYQRVSGITVRCKRMVAPGPERLLPMQRRFRVEEIGYSVEDLLRDPEIQVIDICTPPDVHAQIAEQALCAGKHVICEKPLTGYFGMEGDAEPIGDTVPKRLMYECLLEGLRRLESAVESSGKLFMYAENFVYAPSVQKAAEIISARKSRILLAKGEESLNGSSSPVAGRWSKTGGGTFMRTGTHPLSALLWLKQVEAEALGRPIRVSSVVADMGRVLPGLTQHERRHLAARPNDVEDVGTAILTFTDGSRALVIAADTLLGGSQNCLELYCNDAVLNCRLTLSDLMQTFLPDEDGLGGVELSEMLPSKRGWNKPCVADGVIRGYAGEMQDFMESVAYGRQPASGFALARDTARVIYAAYASAESGRRVEL